MAKRYWVLYKTVHGWRLDRKVGNPVWEIESSAHVLPYWLGEFLSLFVQGWKS